MSRKKAKLYTGTSGYQYDHWKDRVYPADIPRARWFEVYARRFDTVEINNTFYHLPDQETFDSWRKRAPRGFVYALKFSRYGSHMKRLRDPGDTVSNFVARARTLGPHLGPILVQLPPRWHADPGRLEHFLDACPRDLRWAVEFRDPDWLCRDVMAILRRFEAALCVHDKLDRHPREPTAGWAYFRFHGDDYAGTYSPQYLSARAREFRRLIDNGIDVYAYFNNDEDGYAPENAEDLARYLGSRP